jgi:serine-type D-Ala-D-Ala carboxypeptidase
MDAVRLAIAAQRVGDACRERVCTAAVLLAARHGVTVHLSAFGETASGAPAGADAVFDLASLTKPVAAAALLTLVEDGAVCLSAAVREWLPDAENGPLADVSIRHLATHTSGLPPWRALHDVEGGRPAMLSAILSAPLETPPGTRYAYSDLGYLLIGEIVERASGHPLEQYVRQRLLEPLRMSDTGYQPGAALRPRIAPTANCPVRPGATLVGEVHDANAFAYGGIAGHAGLFGTAPDLANLMAALSPGAPSGTPRVLGPCSLRLARTSQIPAALGGQSIGWFTSPNPMLPRADLLGDTAFGHTGFTGTMVVCDPELGLTIILLTNRVVNPADNAAVARLRRCVVNAVASAVAA